MTTRPASRPPLGRIYAAVLATGAAGLVYEVAWQRYLSRLLGSDHLATATVLAVFLGGLSLGYGLSGLLTTRVRNHFRTYALLEGLIGVWGLLFPDIFAAVDSLSAGWSFEPVLGTAVQGGACALLLMGLPTACMGGTIPFLTRALSRSLDESTSVHATVYGVNTAGAFLGALLAGFCLIPVLGLPWTVRAAALVNLAAAALFLLLPAPPAGQARPGPAKAAPPAPGPARSLLAVAFLSGFYVMTLENALIRFVNLSIGSSSYAFTMIVSAFILAIALGGYAVGRPRTLPAWSLFANQLAIAALLAGLYLTLDTWPYWAHRIRIAFAPDLAGFWSYHAAVLAVLTGVLLPAVGLMGATAPLVFHELKRSLDEVGLHSGAVFAWNTAGSLAGSLAGGIALYLVLDNGGVFLAAAALAGVSACLAAARLPRPSRPALAAGLAVTIALLLALPWTPGFQKDRFSVGTFRLDLPMPFSHAGPDEFFRRFHEDMTVVFSADGPAASVAVVETEPEPWYGQRPRSIMINGKSDSSTVGDMYTIKLAAHLPALLAGRPRDALVIGLGTGATAGELLLYPEVERVEVAEIAEPVVRALPCFDGFTHGLRADPRTRIVLGDAFRIIRRSGRTWDVIVSEPSNPWVTGVDLLFTAEFYRLVRERLSPDGVFVQWIHTFDADPAMLATIAATLHREFPESRVFMSQANDLLILASMRPLGLDDLDRARSRLASSREARESLKPLGLDSLEAILLREIWTPSFVRDRFADGPIQTLDLPRLHYLAGKCYFLGRRTPPQFLLPAETARYAGEYLLTRARPDFPADARELASLLASARDLTRGDEHELPMADALRLRAHRKDPERFPLPEPSAAGSVQNWIAP